MWEEEGVEEDLGGIVECTAPTVDSSSRALVIWLVYFISLLQKQHYIPNAAISSLLSFLSAFFGVLARISPQISDIFQQFPSTLRQLETLMGTHEEKCVRYVFCEKCSNIYKYEDCIEESGVPKLCKHQASNHARPCRGALLKCVERPSKNVILKSTVTHHYITTSEYC